MESCSLPKMSIEEFVAELERIGGAVEFDSYEFVRLHVPAEAMSASLYEAFAAYASVIAWLGELHDISAYLTFKGGDDDVQQEKPSISLLAFVEQLIASKGKIFWAEEENRLILYHLQDDLHRPLQGEALYRLFEMHKPTIRAILRTLKRGEEFLLGARGEGTVLVEVPHKLLTRAA